LFYDNKFSESLSRNINFLHLIFLSIDYNIVSHV
jgi:hypothetical protein